VPIGIGDDAAAVRFEDRLVVVTADMLLDGVHFDIRQHSYEQIGRKAVACSLSDCAAMACKPRSATVSVAFCESMSLEEAMQLYEGMAGIAGEFDCPIVGGDITSWPGGLAIDVAVLAEPVTGFNPVRRSGAHVGDTIYVSGPLGGSRLGKHLSFRPQLQLACMLVQEPDLHAMMDISDGLGLDLYRLCEASGCDAELFVEQLEKVISDAARSCASGDDKSPLEHALYDGEDFELLVVGGYGLKHERFGLTPIGRMVSKSPEDKVTMILRDPDGFRERIEPGGYEHFL
ncbi:MAG: thiamine-phosphate kinase, partial [Planctomycetota bacterium]|jgi:thiamine-monophosphate kinase